MLHRMPHKCLRRAISISVTAAAASLLLGCETTRPTAEFRQAADIVSERTGVTEIYDPEVEREIAGRVAGLLSNSVTIDQAVQIALLNNRQLHAAFLNIGVSKADLVQSGLLTNPNLSLAFRFPEGGGVTNITVNIAQQIVDLWQIPIRHQIADARLADSILSAADQAVRLAAAVRKQCHALLAAEQIVELTQQNRAAIERSMQVVEARYKAGEVGEFDLNLTRNNLIDVELSLMQSRGAAVLARSELAHTLGLSRWDTPWELRDQLPIGDTAGYRLDELIPFAMVERLDAQAAARRADAAAGELLRAHAGVFPNIALGFELERLERRTLPGRKLLADTARSSIAAGTLSAPSIDSRGQRRIEKSQIIDAILGPAVDLTLPIFDQNQAQVARARYELLTTRNDFEALLDTVAREVQDALDRARRARQMADYYAATAMPAAEQNVAFTRRAYEAGEVPVLALADAQEELLTRLQGQTAARRELAMALADLELAVGGRLPAPTPPSATTDDESKRE